MGAKAKKFKDELIRKVVETSYTLEPEILDAGDYTRVRPKRVEKKFSKQEILDLISKTYKEL